MSKSNVNFTMIDNNILDNTTLSVYEKLTYVILSRYSNQENQCFPSVKTLAKKVGCSIRKMGEVVKSLVAKGLITIKNRRRSDGGKTSNLYTLIKRTINTQFDKLRACIKQPSNCTNKGIGHGYRTLTKPITKLTTNLVVSNNNNYKSKQSGFINFKQRDDWNLDEIEKKLREQLEQEYKI